MALNINHQTNDITTESGKVKLNGTELGGTGGSGGSAVWYGDRGLTAGFSTSDDRIDYYNITSAGNATDFGNMSSAGRGNASLASNGPGS